jgi:LacI family transcriptional regulator
MFYKHKIPLLVDFCEICYIYLLNKSEFMTATSAKRVTMRDIAQASGTSPATVSLALADSPQIGAETKERILQLCDELGYQRTHLRRNSTKAAALRFGFLSVGTALDEESIAPLLKALTRETSKQGIRLELSAVDSDQSASAMKAQISNFASELDGVFLYGLVPLDVRRACKRAKIRAVMIGHGLAGDADSDGRALLPGVISNPRAMGEQATDWLFQKGHERIAFFCSWMPKGMFSEQWLDGYYISHHHAGRNVDPDLVYYRRDRFARGTDAVQHYLSLPTPPTAWIVPDALAANGLRDALSHAGITLSEDDMVLCSIPENAVRFNLTEFSRFTDDFDAMAANAIHLLKFPAENNAPIQVIVPYSIDWA